MLLLALSCAAVVACGGGEVAALEPGLDRTTR
jgi:hypothetical protein